MAATATPGTLGTDAVSLLRDLIRFNTVNPPGASTDAEPGATTTTPDGEPEPEPEPKSTSREVGWAIDNATDDFDTDAGAAVRKRYQDESDQRAF